MSSSSSSTTSVAVSAGERESSICSSCWAAVGRRQQQTSHRCYYTNADRLTRDDPYKILGLQYGDGSTTSEIKQAYRKKASELHPDKVAAVAAAGGAKEPNMAQVVRDFQDVQWAYETLTKGLEDHRNGGAEMEDQWRVAVWRKGDRIALDRKDVAGVRRVRPAQPASVDANKINNSYMLGHPGGKGVVLNNKSSDEYLTDGTGNVDGTRRVRGNPSSSVGRGQSKWVQGKKTEYKPWNPSSSLSPATPQPSATTAS